MSTPETHTPCGCTVNDGHIVSCPLHAAAPEMLAFIRAAAEGLRLITEDDARALLARIEGK